MVSTSQFKDKIVPGEYEYRALWDVAFHSKEAAAYIEEYVVDKEGKLLPISLSGKLLQRQGCC